MQMRLQGMVDGLEAIEQDEAARDLGFEERLALIVDRQYTWRQNLAFQQRLRRARLRGNAFVEDTDYRAHRGTDIWFITAGPRCYSAIWEWRAPTAVCATC